jgi:predicted nucleic acid-binding protein
MQHEPLLDRVWQLHANLTAYDAAYVALAEALDATLITCDNRLGHAVPPTIRVDVVRPGAR